MTVPEPCELHDHAIVAGTQESEAFLQLSRSPLADECQRCSVCRAARTYIERRLAERAGRTLPPNANGDVAWRHLQAALAEVRAAVHRPD